MSRNDEVPFQLFRFAIVGALGTGTNLVVAFVSYGLLGLHELTAVIIAFTVAVTQNFFLDKYWTFDHQDWSLAVTVSQYVRFVTFSLGGLAVNLLVIFVMVTVLGVLFYISQVMAILLAFLLNFALNKLLNFKNEGEEDE